MSSPAFRNASTTAAASSAAPRGVTATVTRPSQLGSSTPTVVTPAGIDSAATSGIRQMPSPAAMTPSPGGPAPDGVRDDRLGEGGPRPELRVAAGVLSGDPRLPGQVA